MHSARNRVLCVDDDEESCRLMKFLLEMWNYEVALASTAADGLRLAQTEHFDMYLLDSRLPEVSGLEICEKICEVAEHAPVVFISAAAYATDKERGLNAGAVAYLTKPLDFGALEMTLARLFCKPLEKPLELPFTDHRAVVAGVHSTQVYGN